MTNLTDIRSSVIDASGATLQVYATLNDLPTTGLTSGDQAYVTASSRLYISNGSGWYNVALINATPRLTLSQDGSIALASDGTTTTVITLTAVDSDNSDANLALTAESGGDFFKMATVSQDSSVFTITPRSKDSATSLGDDGSSSLTFKASDGINFASNQVTFTLAFTITNSKYTGLLIQADASGTDNQVDASTNTHTITENGVRSTSLTPHHPGGYSWGWAGDGTDYWTINSPTSALSFGTGDFCVEMWIYPNSVASGILLDMRPDETNGNYIGAYGLSSGNTALGHNGVSGTSSGRVTSGTPVVAYQWNHLVLNRESGNLNMFVNGVRGFTTTTVYTFNVGKFRLFKNAYSAGGVSDGSGGWLRDYRVVKGSSVYGYGSTYTVPTEPLTAITGTSLLLFGKPYRHDAVGTETVSYTSGHFDRNGPYNYSAYTKANHGGSVYFDGNDDLDLDFNAIGTSDFTIECWVFIDDSTAHQVICDFRPTSTDNTTGLNIQFRSNNVAYVGTEGTGLITGTTAMPDYSWNHIAVTRNGSTLTLWVNGTSQGTTTHSVNLTSTDMKIGTNRTGASVFNGHISDFRLVKSAVYTTAFSPPTAPLTAIANTEILTCTNKNKFFDASATAPLLTAFNNITTSTSEVSYTGTSLYIAGRSDYLSFDTTDAAFNTLPGDFTIELECKLTSSNMAYAFLVNLYDGGTAGNARIRFGDSGFGYHLQFIINNGGGASSVYSVDLVQSDFTSAFRHIAWTREGGVNRIFVDGILYNVATGSNPSTFSGTSWTDSTTIDFNHSSGIRIGVASYSPLGYLQNIRITNGLARYTSNFTAPTAEFGG